MGCALAWKRDRGAKWRDKARTCAKIGGRLGEDVPGWFGGAAVTAPRYNVVSLGAGRQSTAMVLMAAHGELTPMPEAAIFADTGDEPAWVYETVDWLRSDNVGLPFPVIVTKKGNLGDDLLAGEEAARAPFFLRGGGITGRQCTRNYKIRPIRRAVRKALGFGPRSYIAPGTISQWIGISMEEAIRMKPSGVKFMVNRWPLIEKGLKVRDCEAWLRAHDYPVPWPSACVYCPYLSNKDRRRIQEHDPAGHERAIYMDEALRMPQNVKRFHGQLYVHSNRQPLRGIDLTEPEPVQIELWGNECEGMCGT